VSNTSWAAEASGWIGALSLAAGVVVASSVIVLNARAHPGSFRGRRAGFAARTGVSLVAVAAVLAASGGGRELWLTGLGGFLCLWVAATIRLRFPDDIGDRGGRPPVLRDPADSGYHASVGAEAAQDVDRLLRRLDNLVGEVERRAIAQSEYHASVRALEATQDVNRLLRRLDDLVGEVERRVPDRETPDRITPPGDFPEVTQPLAAQGVWAPVSVYTSDDDGTPLKNAVVEVLHAFELTVVGEEPVEPGSWFQRFWTRARSDSVRERMRKLEQAVELQYLGKVRAEIDQAKAHAVAALLQAISAQDNAVVRIGSLIAIKAQGNLAVWTVSELEAADMERHSALLRDPVSALEYLRNLKQESGEAPPPLQRSADD
jgi:hypothetical protein